MSICVFGYGSLINHKSAENALKRPLTRADMLPATLYGFVRVWRAKEQIWFDGVASKKTGVFLDLERRDNARVNGVLIEISDRELQQLKLREKNYECVDVTAKFEQHNCERIYTFISQFENRLRPDDLDVYIPIEYIRLVENGCAAIGPSFLTDYQATTELIELPMIDGPYRFVDPIQGQFI